MARKKSNISNAERKTITTLANAFLTNPNNTQAEKEDMFWNVSHLLTEHNCYEGYNWIRWAKEGGCTKWFADGEPAERFQEKYMGLEWNRFFY